MEIIYITNILKELLTEYNRVSLPCLGGFIGRNKSAEISEDGKTLLPPSKQIDFYQNEIWNDERLEKALAEKEGISLGEAKERVAFWIDDVSVELAINRKFELPGLGEFQVTDDNKLTFVLLPDINLQANSFGLVPLELPDEQAVIDSQTEKKTTVQQPVIEQAPQKEPEQPVEVKTKAPKKSNNKKNGWLWAIIILLICMLGLLVWAMTIFFLSPSAYDDPKETATENIQDVTATTTTPEISLKDIIGPDTEGDSLNIYMPPVRTIDSAALGLIDTLASLDSLLVDITTPAIDTLYHIIVSVSSDINAARSNSRNWAGKGYACRIIQTDEGIPYKVSIERFSEMDVAKDSLAQMKKRDPELKSAWVLKYAEEKAP